LAAVSATCCGGGLYAEFAQRLISQARRLYGGDELCVDLTSTVYALDSTTIDLCLSVFPWAHFRSTKAAVKMHTLLDLRGNIPSFIHISDGKLHDVHALDMLLPEPGAIYVMDRRYVDFPRPHVLHQAGAFFVTKAESNLDTHRVYSALPDKSEGVICDQTIALDGYVTQPHYPGHLRRIRFKGPETGKTLVFLTSQVTLPALTVCALYKSRWQVIFQVDQAAPSDQAGLRRVGECGENPNLDRRLRVRSGRHRMQAARSEGGTVPFFAGCFGSRFRETPDPGCIVAGRLRFRRRNRV
jgi:hypothetical protein